MLYFSTPGWRPSGLGIAGAMRLAEAEERKRESGERERGRRKPQAIEKGKARCARPADKRSDSFLLELNLWPGRGFRARAARK